MLGFQRQPVRRANGGARRTDHPAIQVVRRIDLHPRLGGEQLQGPAADRIGDPRRQFQRAGL